MRRGVGRAPGRDALVLPVVFGPAVARRAQHPALVALIRADQVPHRERRLGPPLPHRVQHPHGQRVLGVLLDHLPRRHGQPAAERVHAALGVLRDAVAADGERLAADDLLVVLEDRHRPGRELQLIGEQHAQRRVEVTPVHRVQHRVAEALQPLPGVARAGPQAGGRVDREPRAAGRGHALHQPGLGDVGRLRGGRVDDLVVGAVALVPLVRREHGAGGLQVLPERPPPAAERGRLIPHVVELAVESAAQGQPRRADGGGVGRVLRRLAPLTHPAAP